MWRQLFGLACPRSPQANAALGVFPVGRSVVCEVQFLHQRHALGGPCSWSCSVASTCQTTGSSKPTEQKPYAKVIQQVRWFGGFNAFSTTSTPDVTLCVCSHDVVALGKAHSGKQQQRC